MGLAIKPIECPGGCLGCYERKIRENGSAPPFDLQKVLATLDAQMALDKDNSWNSPTLHGGEPLALPIEAVEAVLARVYAKYGKSGIQTSGAYITPAHIDLFMKYKTDVGISIDGDNARTNGCRWNAPGFVATLMTEATLYAMRELKMAGVQFSTIVVLRKCNAGTPKLREELVSFALRMTKELGASSSRFNPFISFDERAMLQEELDNFSLAEVYHALVEEYVQDNSLKWYPIIDFIRGLQGGKTECVFGECDPWATEAEIPILGDGSLGVCFKGGGGPDGVATLRVEKTRARYEALSQVNQESGGCLGCFWWSYCKGGCPGAGIDGDWRNRTRFCEVYKSIFLYIIKMALFPAKDTAPKNTRSHGDRAHGDSNDPTWRAANPWWRGKICK